tara:strand:+ start:2998 stop:3306 length:309 start_codon:yes stop_codon:yes gene_type:complete
MACRRSAKNLAQKSKLKRSATAMAAAKVAGSNLPSETSNMTTTSPMDWAARQKYQTAAFCAGTATAKKRIRWIVQKWQKLTAYVKKLTALKVQAIRANGKEK